MDTVARGHRSLGTAEAQIETFIERRHDQRTKADGRERAEEELWQVSARIYNNGKERERAIAFSEHPHETDETLERLLVRAERSQDPELATAVYHVATEKGVRKVADAYLEKRPQEKRRWEEEFVAAKSQEAESTMGIGSILERGLADKAMNSPEFTARG